MTRKALWLLPASVAAVVASQWRDIARYVKIRQMSRGGPDRNADSGPDRNADSGPDRNADSGPARSLPATALRAALVSGTARCRR
jgi:hypothetical protein